jgi:hypothetical protein
MATRILWWSVLVSSLAGVSAGRADETAKEVKPGTLAVTDHAGREHVLKTWKFIRGTQRLPWPAAGGKPECLVFRTENSTDLQDGIVTFVPLDRIRTIDFDNAKRTVTVRVAAAGAQGDGEVKLTGSTRYQDNKISIEAETDLGKLGVATVKFSGGIAKGGIRSVRFPAPKGPFPKLKGRQAAVTSIDKENNVHKVWDLQPLYVLGTRGARLIPTLLFKKTVKIELADIKKLALVEGGEKGAANEFEVTLKDGRALTLTLLDRVSPLDRKPARLVGLAGEVPEGYKLFPVKASPNHVFTKVELDTGKEEK